MGHNSVSGVGGHSSYGSHLDFVSYWADKTVEEAILQGQQLRLQKAQPIPLREYDVVNIDFIKPPRSVKSSSRRRQPSSTPSLKIRKKSAKVPSKRHRSRSPVSGISPSTNLPKRQKKRKKTIPPCGMRIAELAVPTKRHCLETWKSKYNTLPDYMIERLRKHILHQRPVIQISEAINCFKRKCKRRKRTEKSVSKAVESMNKIKNPLRKNEIKVLGAIFGHRIAKKLIVPLNIILNSDLEKIAGVISYDIGALMRKVKQIDTKNTLYQLIEKDIVKKITVWVSGVLDESCEKMLEDRLRDFEEEAGPALDCIDDLVDNVLDICIPVPETLDEYFTSESDESDLAEGILETQISSGNIDLKDEYLYENNEDYLQNEIVTLINNAGKKTDQRSDEYLDIDGGPDRQSSGDIEANGSDKKNEDYVKAEEGTALEQADDEEDALEPDKKNEDYVEADEGTALEPDKKNEDYVETEEGTALEQAGDEEGTALEEAGDEEGTAFKQAEGEGGTALEQNETDEGAALEQPDILESSDFKHEENDEAKEIDIKDSEHLQGINEAAEQPIENAETEDTGVNNEDQKEENDIAESNERFDNKVDTALLLSDGPGGKDDEKENKYLESEDVAQSTDAVETLLENTDDIIETFADATEENEVEDNPPLPEEMDRKVTFEDLVTDEHKTDVDLNWKASIEHIAFLEPNEGLLSDADESWPEDVQTPFLRPSQSVSKSITSLGRIREVEEKLSIRPEEESKGIEIEYQTKPAKSDEQDEQKSTIESMKSKDETGSKDSGKKDKTLSEIEYQTKPANSVEQDEQKSTIESMKSKDETGSKDSGKKDKIRSGKIEKNIMISSNKMSKPTIKKPTPSASQRSHSKFRKLKMASPAKPISKTLKKINDKHLKSMSPNTGSTRTSHSVKDLEIDVKPKDDMFSSRVKSKPDYRVNFKTAPDWINRNFREPSCSCVHIPSKYKVKPKVNENVIRRWCQDLEQGYENLKMWNEWVENTTRTVFMLQREIGKSYCPERCSNKEWVKLKRNIDKDAQLWTKLNQHTQERLKCYKKMYKKRSDTPSNYFICCSQHK